MRVLMLGWEFPPFISGGLGTACFGLTKAMSQIGTDVLFVLPKPVETQSSHVQILSPNTLSAKLAGLASEYELTGLEHVKFCALHAAPGMSPYHSPEQYEELIREKAKRMKAIEGGTLAEEPVVAQTHAQNGSDYEGDMFQQIERYARLACGVAEFEKFDVIHAHD